MSGAITEGLKEVRSQVSCAYYKRGDMFIVRVGNAWYRLGVNNLYCMSDEDTLLLNEWERDRELEATKELLNAITTQDNPESFEAFKERCDLIADAANRGISAVDIVKELQKKEGGDARRTKIGD